MTNKETADAWERFQADVKAMAGELRRHYDNADDKQKTAEINRSLRQLGEAAEQFFGSLDTTSRDPEVRATTRQAAQSFGTALRETFREVSEELSKAFQPSAKK
jgi:hypothetical protein